MSELSKESYATDITDIKEAERKRVSRCKKAFEEKPLLRRFPMKYYLEKEKEYYQTAKTSAETSEGKAIAEEVHNFFCKVQIEDLTNADKQINDARAILWNEADFAKAFDFTGKYSSEQFLKQLIDERKNCLRYAFKIGHLLDFVVDHHCNIHDANKVSKACMDKIQRSAIEQSFEGKLRPYLMFVHETIRYLLIQLAKTTSEEVWELFIAQIKKSIPDTDQGTQDDTDKVSKLLSLKEALYFFQMYCEFTAYNNAIHSIENVYINSLISKTNKDFVLPKCREINDEFFVGYPTKENENEMVSKFAEIAESCRLFGQIDGAPTEYATMHNLIYNGDERLILNSKANKKRNSKNGHEEYRQKAFIKDFLNFGSALNRNSEETENIGKGQEDYIRKPKDPLTESCQFTGMQRGYFLYRWKMEDIYFKTDTFYRAKQINEMVHMIGTFFAELILLYDNQAAIQVASEYLGNTLDIFWIYS